LYFEHLVEINDPADPLIDPEPGTGLGRPDVPGARTDGVPARSRPLRDQSGTEAGERELHFGNAASSTT
jgi:hypothetical protein